MDAELRFRAMGCEVHVLIAGGRPELLETSRELLDDLERRWSRFREDSEVSQLNRLAGRPVRVSRQTVRLVARALEGARATGGRYDPTALGAVVRAGYDRSFELLDGDGAGGAGWSHPAGSALDLGWERIVVDPALSTVTLPRGVGFDPGGIGKGLAADLVVAELLAAGAGRSGRDDVSERIKAILREEAGREPSSSTARWSRPRNGWASSSWRPSTGGASRWSGRPTPRLSRCCPEGRVPLLAKILRDPQFCASRSLC